VREDQDAVGRVDAQRVLDREQRVAVADDALGLDLVAVERSERPGQPVARLGETRAEVRRPVAGATDQHRADDQHVGAGSEQVVDQLGHAVAGERLVRDDEQVACERRAGRPRVLDGAHG
jgi:hypothetical protein